MIFITTRIIKGKICYSKSEVLDNVKKGIPVIFYSKKINNSLIELVSIVDGFILKEGGETSHIAIVCKTINKPCVLGYNQSPHSFKNEIIIDCKNKEIRESTSSDSNFYEIQDSRILDYENDKLLINFDSDIDLPEVKINKNFGIGLCRTEHFFDSPTTLKILVDYLKTKDAMNLVEIERLHVERFMAISKNLQPGNKFTIRLLDPPLNEFLDRKSIKQFNTSMGVRGIRILFEYPDLVIAQLKAIKQFIDRDILNLHIRILLPMVISKWEVFYISELMKYLNLDCDIGIMFEIPSNIDLVKDADLKIDFISIGTNDLYQFWYGLDRDNAFLNLIYSKEDSLINKNDFLNYIKSIIVDCKSRGLKVGICGEMISNEEFLNLLPELDYISVNISDLYDIKKYIMV